MSAPEGSEPAEDGLHSAPTEAVRPVCPIHGEPLQFYDKSVMEFFVNDVLQTVTRVAIPPSPALHLDVAATGGAAMVRLTAWPIKHSEENS